MAKLAAADRCLGNARGGFDTFLATNAGAAAGDKVRAVSQPFVLGWELVKIGRLRGSVLNKAPRLALELASQVLVSVSGYSDVHTF